MLTNWLRQGTSTPGRSRVSRLKLSAVAGAMVVNVLALFHFTYQEAAAMAAVHKPEVRKIVFHLARTILGARIQQLLNALPSVIGQDKPAADNTIYRISEPAPPHPVLNLDRAWYITPTDLRQVTKTQTR